MVQRKSRQELEMLREAGKVLSRTLDLVRSMIAPGIRTVDLDRAAEAFIRSHGGSPTFKGYMGFPATLCTSINDQVVHGIPGERELHEGDLISVDCGVTLNGYIADAAFTAPVGRVDRELSLLMDATRTALNAAISNCHPGTPLGTVSHAVEAHVTPQGYTVVRDYCGHGVGKALHEEPQIPNYGRPGKGSRLQTGWVFAIEPMVNLGTHQVRTLPDGWTVVTADGRPSAHFEHTIAVTDDGPLILTAP